MPSWVKNIFMRAIYLICVACGIVSCSEYDLGEALQSDKYVVRYLDSRGEVLTGFADFEAETKEYTRLIKENVAPEGAASLGVYDSTGCYVGSIGLGNLKHDYGTKLYSFGMMSDVHIGKDNSEENLKKSLNFFRNYGVRFVGCLGDIANYGNHLDALQTYDKYIKDYSDLTIYTCVGNHENNEPSEVSPFGIMTLEAWQTYTGMDDKNVKIDIEAGLETHHVIVFSCVANDGPYDGLLGAYYSDETLDWLESSVEACGNDKFFVFMHVPFPDKCNWGYDYSTRRILNNYNTMFTQELARLRTLVAKNPNSVWFMGHTHEPWEKQGIAFTNTTNANKLFERGDISAEQLDKGKNYDANVAPCNVTERTEGWSVHIPANFQGGFAVVDVYQDYIIVKGLTDGRYIPIAQYKLALE